MWPPPEVGGGQGGAWGLVEQVAGEDWGRWVPRSEASFHSCLDSCLSLSLTLRSHPNLGRHFSHLHGPTQSGPAQHRPPGPAAASTLEAYAPSAPRGR